LGVCTSRNLFLILAKSCNSSDLIIDFLPMILSNLGLFQENRLVEGGLLINCYAIKDFILLSLAYLSELMYFRLLDNFKA
jgi:hypothetical protein